RPARTGRRSRTGSGARSPDRVRPRPDPHGGRPCCNRARGRHLARRALPRAVTHPDRNGIENDDRPQEASMTPDDIDRDFEDEVKRIEETVIDEVQKGEEEVNRLIDDVAEEQKKYKDVTGWPPV